MLTTVELRHERATLIEEARKIVTAAKKENRSMTAEENAKWDKIIAQADGIKDTYERLERQEVLDRELSESTRKENDDRLRRDEENSLKDVPEHQKRFATKEYAKRFNNYCRFGPNRMDPSEVRALQADVLAAGGYTQMPFDLANQIAMDLKNQVFVRRWATVHPLTKAAALRVSTKTADVDDAEWTTELLTGTLDTGLAFGARDLEPELLVKGIKVSDKLLEVSEFSIETLVRTELAYKFGITQEKGFLTGPGTTQTPLGLFTASANGISTGRDVATGNTATAFTYLGLVNAKYSIPAAYRSRPSFRWIFHRDAVKMAMTLLDNNDRPIWIDSMRPGEPGTILGVPYDESEYAPNTFTTGLYVGLIGDLSYYHIAETVGYQVVRDDSIYVLTNEILFKGRTYVDGMPVRENGFARVKLG